MSDPLFIRMRKILMAAFAATLSLTAFAATIPDATLSEAAALTGAYDVVWHTQSLDASASMPCGGGDIGLNVWCEGGELLFYLSRSGTFDENNTMLKMGRVRVSFDTPLDSVGFTQRLNLASGRVEVEAGRGRERVSLWLWCEIHRPVVHLEISSARPRKVVAAYETWRFDDRLLRKNESFQNSYKWAPPKGLTVSADDIRLTASDKGRPTASDHDGAFRFAAFPAPGLKTDADGVFFCHVNPERTVFDVCLEQQRLDTARFDWYNPLKGRISGGWMTGENFCFKDTVGGICQQTPFRAYRLESCRAVRQQAVSVTLFTSDDLLHQAYGLSADASPEEICRAIVRQGEGQTTAQQREQAEAWWRQFWQRSFIELYPESGAGASVLQADVAADGSSGVYADASAEARGEIENLWRIGRNYQLFRYQLGCNAYGAWPTKFNGGLFTFDPVFVHRDRPFTPDYRNWGGGTFTAQNQRLVYFGLLKSGDTDMLTPQLEFYRRMLPNAEARSRIYWGHEGACFTEQTENFGLPNPSEYGWKRPEEFDPGVEYNKWLEYQWDTALEFCLMALEAERYAGFDATPYIPLTESVLTFFDRHYRFLARQRGVSELDSAGHLRLYPGSGCETYKLADNAASTVAALRTVTAALLARTLPGDLAGGRPERWAAFYETLPELPLRTVDSVEMIAPARRWERVQNTEVPQLYPVWPWRMYGLTKPGLEVALNTYLHDPDALKFRSHTGWKQDNIFAACLGLTDEAARLAKAKFADAPLRFPTFWGPGFDWTPDHNRGGSAMIGLQEMLLQCEGDHLLLFPAWPAGWDVRFRLCAPHNTVVEAVLKDGRVTALKVTPASRLKDVKLMLPGSENILKNEE